MDWRAAPGGDPFTADDVVYTINTVLTDKQASVPSNFIYLASAEKIDELPRFYLASWKSPRLSRLFRRCEGAGEAGTSPATAKWRDFRPPSHAARICSGWARIIRGGSR
jgi:hypothetical protein